MNAAITLDPSAVRLIVAQRYGRETDAEEKLALLRRLQRRYVECRLPRESESRVEQSFNEQLFARIFGYRTLFSHEPLPYHLRPKNFASGSRRFDDFSLGEFWGDERDRVVATAEFKDPGTDLDLPQTDRKERISPVEQAFRAARGFSACNWVIVSNFRDLRLYQIDDAQSPLVSIDLHDVQSRKALARLCAHFDFDALIGSGRKPDMSVALDPNHPSVPIAPGENSFRFIATFTHRAELQRTLCELYDACRDAASALLKVNRDDWDKPTVPVRIEDGWCCAETETFRLAVSTEGQVRLSIRHLRTCSPAQINPDAEFFRMAFGIHDFVSFVLRLFRSIASNLSVEGRVNIELREIKGWRIYFDDRKLLKQTDNTNSGVADKDEIVSGDFSWTSSSKLPHLAANCMGELALQFKTAEGDRVRFDHAALANYFERKE